VSAVATRSVGAALRALTARDGVIDAPAPLAAFAVDGVTPRWVARPCSVEQLAAVMTLAAEEKLTVMARGGGAALELGAPLARLDLVVDLTGLAAIVEHNADDLTITVQAGLPLQALNRYLHARRQWLPLDPEGDHTVGGVAATGVSGPLRFRYGTMRDLLLGVRFVQADGVVTWGGSKVVKSVTGYDVPKLMVGALGTLGVLAELTLRLHARPDVERTWLAAVPSAVAAQTLVASILDSALQPNRIELVDERALPGAGAPLALLVSFGSVEEAVAEQGERLVEMTRAVGAETRAVAGEWTTSNPRSGGDRRTTLRVGSLPGRLASTFETLARAVQRIEGAQSTVSAHAGLGVWRIAIDGGPADAVAACVMELRAALADHDGYVVITGGPADVRRRVDPWGPVAPDALALMRSIKATFDPEHRLNPGRFVGGL
jgi:glycolate oxidase FAD binding subunit